jgi:hypothetical protein
MNVGDSAALETIDSAIGRNRRIVPTNVSQMQILMHDFSTSAAALYGYYIIPLVNVMPFGTKARAFNNPINFLLLDPCWHVSVSG